MSKANESAFPEVKSSQSGDYSDSPLNGVWSEGGLTKRELFAAMAMQGLLANPNDIPSVVKEDGGPLESQLARVSIALAHALIKELEKSDETP